MKRIGVIGAGAMGSGIAQVAATAGHDVLIYDVQQEAVMRAQSNLTSILNRLVEKEKISDSQSIAIHSRHLFVDSISALSECDLIIEAVVELLPVKCDLFQQLEAIVSEDTIIATNTSSLAVTAIAASCKSPERVVGLHFFNPAPLMSLVEIVPAVQTDKKLLPGLKDLMISWGKLPVVTKDTPGFIVNRVARPYYSEALRIFDEGLASIQDIDASMLGLGFRMGPFTLMDFIGHDVNFAVTSSMYASNFHEARYKPSCTQQRLVDAGYLGKKSGRGFYEYDGLDKDMQVGVAKEWIQNRILYMLINEAADALYYGVADAADIDHAMTKGVNYPIGLLRWAEQIGVPKIVLELDRLFEYYHEERYRVSPALRERMKYDVPLVR